MSFLYNVTNFTFPLFLHSIMFTHFLSFLTAHLGYREIFIFMLLEATFLPVPTEAVMPTVGYLASVGNLNVSLAYLVGIMGIVAGVSVNYFIGLTLWRTFLLKYGKYIGIKASAYHKVEKIFLENDIWFTFFGRFVPALRHLISFPAGIFKMPYFLFVGLSVLGSGIYFAILMSLGYFFGKNMDTVASLVHNFTIGLLLFVIVLVTGIVYWHYKRRNGKKQNPSAANQ